MPPPRGCVTEKRNPHTGAYPEMYGVDRCEGITSDQKPGILRSQPRNRKLMRCDTFTRTGRSFCFAGVNVIFIAASRAAS